MTALIEAFTAVGLGEIHTVTGGSGVLMALGLGSCVGVALYDPGLRAGGMAHVVLPGPLDGRPADSAKFATRAIPELIERLERLGAARARLRCYIAGGAQVLQTGVIKDSFKIGERNIAAVRAELARAGITIDAEDCGGSTGRSFRLVAADGACAVKRLGQSWQPLTWQATAAAA